MSLVPALQLFTMGYKWMELLFVVGCPKKGQETGLIWMLEAVWLMNSKAELSERSWPWSLFPYLPPSFLRWCLLLPEFRASLPSLHTAHSSKPSPNKDAHLFYFNQQIQSPAVCRVLGSAPGTQRWLTRLPYVRNVCFSAGSDFCLKAYRINHKL